MNLDEESSEYEYMEPRPTFTETSVPNFVLPPTQFKFVKSNLGPIGHGQVTAETNQEHCLHSQTRNKQSDRRNEFSSNGDEMKSNKLNEAELKTISTQSAPSRSRYRTLNSEQGGVDDRIFTKKGKISKRTIRSTPQQPSVTYALEEEIRGVSENRACREQRLRRTETERQKSTTVNALLDY